MRSSSARLGFVVASAALALLALPASSAPISPTDLAADLRIRAAALEAAPLFPQGASLAIGPDPGSLFSYGGDNLAGVYAHHLWTRDAAAAAWRTVANTYARREAPLLFWDPVGARLVVHGGSSTGGGLWSDLLAYQPGEDGFHLLPTPPYNSLPDRWTSAYDRLHQRQLLLNRMRTGDQQPLPVLWAFDPAGATWSMLPTDGMPPLRDGSRMTYDAVGERMLVFGETYQGEDLRRVFALDLQTFRWSLVTAEGRSPVPAASMAVFHDAPGNALIVLAVDRATFAVSGARLDLAGTPRWSTLPVVLPTGLTGAALVDGIELATHDPRTNELLVVTDIGVIPFTLGASLVGALPSNPPQDVPRYGAFVAQSAGWWWHDGDATRVHRTSALPGAEDRVFDVVAPPGIRRDAAVVFDVHRQRLLYYGGTVDGVPTNDVLELLLGEVPIWVTRDPWGPPPPALAHPSAVFVGGSSLVLAQPLPGDPSSLPVLELNTKESTWTTRPLAQPLPAWIGWDAVSGRDRRMIYLVGRDDPARPTERRPVLALDAYTYPMEWTALPPAPAVPGAALVFDDSRRWIVLAGGEPDGATTRDVWVLPTYDPAAWLRLEHDTPETPGQTISGGLAEYDEMRDRIVVLGGRTCLPGAGGACLPSVGAQFAFPERVGVLLELVDASPLPDRTIRVRLGSNYGFGVSVARSEDAGATWRELGFADEPSLGQYEYVDQTAVPGRPYRYRGTLTQWNPPLYSEASETVIVPVAQYAVELRANTGSIVSAWPVSLVAQVVAGPAAVVELVDVRGRVLATESVPATAEPVQSFPVRLDPGGHAGAGLYFARLRQGGNRSVVKVIRL